MSALQITYWESKRNPKNKGIRRIKAPKSILVAFIYLPNIYSRFVEIYAKDEEIPYGGSQMFFGDD